jgi:hypothetical protein
MNQTRRFRLAPSRCHSGCPSPTLRHSEHAHRSTIEHREAYTSHLGQFVPFLDPNRRFGLSVGSHQYLDSFSVVRCSSQSTFRRPARRRARGPRAPLARHLGRQRPKVRVMSDVRAGARRWGSRAQRLSRRARVSMTGRAGSYAPGSHWQPIGRWRSLSGLTFPVSLVYARCHRDKKNLRAILRSGSELVSLSYRILLLIACRPRARVIRACAVGIARPGTRILVGRLLVGASRKAGGRWYSLTP